MKYITLLRFPGKLLDSSALAASLRDGSKIIESGRQLEESSEGTEVVFTETQEEPLV